MKHSYPQESIGARGFSSANLRVTNASLSEGEVYRVKTRSVFGSYVSEGKEYLSLLDLMPEINLAVKDPSVFAIEVFKAPKIPPRDAVRRDSVSKLLKELREVRTYSREGGKVDVSVLRLWPPSIPQTIVPDSNHSIVIMVSVTHGAKWSPLRPRFSSVEGALLHVKNSLTWRFRNVNEVLVLLKVVETYLHLKFFYDIDEQVGEEGLTIRRTKSSTPRATTRR